MSGYRSPQRFRSQNFLDAGLHTLLYVGNGYITALLVMVPRRQIGGLGQIGDLWEDTCSWGPSLEAHTLTANFKNYQKI
jgi:hypothetical protein